MPRHDHLKTLDKDEITKIEALAAYLSADQVADYFGMARSTFYELMKRQPDAWTAYRRGRSQAIAVVAKSLIKKARDGDTIAAIFYLKTQAGWREKEPEAENTEDAPPVTINIVAKNARKN